MSHPGSQPNYGPPQGQPYGGQPHGGQPHGGQPHGGQPHGGQPHGGQPHGGQPHGGQPYGGPMPGGRPMPPQPAGYPHGGMPTAPPPVAPVAPPRPPEVETAFRLFLLNIACSVIGVILSFTFISALVDIALEEAGLGEEFAAIARDAAESAGQSQILTQAVGSAIGIALTVFFVLRMRNGKNWARVALTVFGTISVLGILIAHVRNIGDYLSIGAPGTIFAVLAIGQLLLITAAIFFMFRGRSNAYFAGAARAR